VPHDDFVCERPRPIVGHAQASVDQAVGRAYWGVPPSASTAEAPPISSRAAHVPRSSFHALTRSAGRSAAARLLREPAALASVVGPVGCESGRPRRRSGTSPRALPGPAARSIPSLKIDPALSRGSTAALHADFRLIGRPHETILPAGAFAGSDSSPATARYCGAQCRAGWESDTAPALAPDSSLCSWCAPLPACALDSPPVTDGGLTRRS